LSISGNDDNDNGNAEQYVGRFNLNDAAVVSAA